MTTRHARLAESIQVLRFDEVVAFGLKVPDGDKTIEVYAALDGDEHIERIIKGLRDAQRDAHNAGGGHEVVRDQDAGGPVRSSPRPAIRGVYWAGERTDVASENGADRARPQRRRVPVPRLRAVLYTRRRRPTDDQASQ
jgi:hypothetical protein